MASPFPGMDPYLEDPALWPDFHQRFVNYWCEAVADVLPPSYEARLEERISLVQCSQDEARLIRPDISVVRTEPPRGQPGTAGGTLTLEPIIVPLDIYDEVREGYVEILHRPNREVVGVLELLSPSNKSSLGRSQYLLKRSALLQQSIHLIELDLLMGGQRMPTRKPLPAGDYYALVCRSNRRPDADVYAWTVAQPLPAIPIPLKTPDPDVIVDLAKVFAIAYERGRYARSIDYRQPPKIPLEPAAIPSLMELAKRNGV